MKKAVRLIVSLYFVLTSFMAGTASAQVTAYDNATNYTTGWNNGENQGFGFGPWTLATTNIGGGYSGFFIGNSGSTNGIQQPPGPAFGLYANSGETNAAVAFRRFTNSLTTNVVFKVQWVNQGIGFSSANRGGFALRNGNATDSVNDFDTNTRFDFYYIGGGQDSFLIEDGSGVTPVNIGFGQGPLELDFVLLSPDTYRLIIKDAEGVNTLAIFDNMQLAGNPGSTLDSVACYALETSNNQLFNNFTISSTSLLPPDINNLQPTNGTIYASATIPLSFNVTSAFSTVSSNGVQLTLNGENYTNLSFTDSGTTNLGVTLDTPLQANVIYNGTIIATDSNGNHATNNFSFNTFLPTDFFVEASDYNFSSGTWIDAPQPNQDYAGLLGSNGIDYLVFNLAGTNNVYRPGDLPSIEEATDVDHDFFAENGYQPYDLAYNATGQWENYTRDLGSTNYLVYARMAGFGANPVMELENLASSLATTSNQPDAALGTFVCPNTGGTQDYTFVPLKDFFSNPVMVNFDNTNTFRLTVIGSSDSYNVGYLIFVQPTNTATLRPYLSSGFPYPGAANVGPNQLIQFTIANRQTSVNPASIQLFLNSGNVTSGISLSNNAAGTVVSYQSPALLPPGTNTLQTVFSDGTVMQTNTWQFTVVTLPVINPAWALPLSSAVGTGFSIHITKAPDDSPAADFPPSIAQALAQLAGTLTNSSSDQPYINVASGPNGNGLYTETNTINYDITGQPTGSYTFPYKTNFPYVPAAQTNNFISMAVDMYVYLTPGLYNFAVRSDDGFMLAAGPTPTSTNLTLGLFDGGRSDATLSTFEFIVQTNGLYPMQLIYMQGQFSGNIEFYSINLTNGTPTLINDQTTSNSLRAYLVGVTPIALTAQKVGTNVVLSWPNSAFNLQAAPAVTGTYTNITGARSPYTNPISAPATFFRLIH